ncbi:MAG TPA: CHAT domain-containing tetratricopeptide repeat protein [Gemmatimonadales bacterium]|nr:CHAT domain-containing tetratricopeptide repeat protein [Gemmatimonadales bacterium]
MSFRLLAASAVMVQSPSPQAADLRTLAMRGSDSALIAQAHDRPDDLREALRRLFAVAAADTQPAEPLTAAKRLARAYAVAWRDSFLVWQVARFEAWPLAERRANVAADSIRRAGNDALGRAGVGVAMRDWRESMRRCELLHDSAGMGAALGNIGAGFYRSGDLDSAAVYFDLARVFAERVGDRRTEGNAVGALASVEADRGDPRRAAGLYAHAAEIRVLAGDDRGAAADRNNLGLVAQTLGDLDGARRAFTEALASNRAAGRDEPAAVNLINLGNLASLEGDYPPAASRYREALALYRARGNRVEAASALHDLGLLDLQRGEYRAAVTILAQALAVYRETGPLVDVVAVRRDLAAAHAAMGNLQGALIQLREAERLAATGRVGPAVLAQLALARADLAVEFNTFPEAERQFARAKQLSRRAADGRGEADAERGLGLLQLVREDYPRAEAQLALALRAAEVSDDPRAAAQTRLLLGYAQAHRGDTAVAHGTLARALAALQALGDAGGEAAALGTLGGLDQREGLPLAAESLYRRALDRLGVGPAPTISWQLHAGLADALRSRGARDEAEQELRAAVRDVERVSGTLPLEERRVAFLADKWEVYAQLALVELARGQTDVAFEASERLRARQLLDLLARGRVTDAGSGPADSALAARETDLRRQINTLTRQLEGPGAVGPGLRGPFSSEAASGAVREALARAQEAYADLLLQVRETHPEYAALISGEIAPVRQVMKQLAPDEALLEYLVSDSTSLVFVVTSDTVAAIELGVARHELATLVDFSRGVLTRRGRESAPELWRGPLRRLYRYLIEPVQASGMLAGKRALLIAPHAELHYAPFAALLGAPGPDAYLIQRYRLTFVPSASLWLRLGARDRPTGSGVLALAPRVGVLPGSAAEVAAIGRLFGTRAHVLVGDRASKRALRDAAPEQAIVHFATYGVLNKDNPLFSFVELMPQGGDDGRLEVHEVFGLRLHARLVVLSACQTALGAGALADVPAGDDWVGLVQAFLSAGASHVLATLWPVEDRTTAELMTRFYGALSAGQPEAEALAEAQRATLRNPATAHPFYWAGFTLSGGR